MVSGLIILALIMCGAICNAIMDTLADEKHFKASIFGKYNPYFWSKVRSWPNKYIDGNFNKGLRFKYFPLSAFTNFLDAWHLFKMLMLAFLIAAICVAMYSATIIPWWLFIPATYPAWNGTFELFYSILFKRK